VKHSLDKPRASETEQLGAALGTRSLPPPSCVDPMRMLRAPLQRDAITPLTNYLGTLGSYALPVDDASTSGKYQAVGLAAMREARIFDLGSALHEFYAKAYELVSNVYGLNIPPQSTRAETMKAEIEFYTKLHSLPASVLPRAPSKLPFKSIYVAYAGPVYTSFGSALRLTSSSESYYARFENEELVGMPMGLLISEHVIFEYCVIYDRANPSNMRHGHILLWSSSEGWIKPQTVMPWIVTLIVDYLNSHNTLHHGRIDKKTQHAIIKQSKRFTGGSVRPRDYYTLLMRRVTLDDRALKFKERLEKRMHKYRTDVRGHESVRVMRGKLPLTPKDEKELRDRHYRIYAGTELSPEDRDRLEHRDIAPKAPGEWIAVLSWWRDSFMSPANPELPYVPAVRTPTEPVIS
jgi:hypothetical protein